MIALDALRPKPFRGPVIAAGVVVLATLVLLLQLRFNDAWPAGVHLLYAGPAFALVVAMAWLAPLEGETPRPYQSVLYVTSLPLGIVAFGDLTDVLGADAPLATPGAAACALALVAGVMLAFARRRNSAVSLLGAALAAVGATIAVTIGLFGEGLSARRLPLLAWAVLLALAAVAIRDARPRHAVALVNAVGLAALAIAYVTWTTPVIVAVRETSEIHYSIGWGWELLTLAVGFGLCAYAAVDREPGPGYLGAANIGAYLVMDGALSSQAPSFLGWPLALAVAAGVLLIVGLRPTTPAPPSPDTARGSSDVTPLRG